jgi:hypothetical protein
MNIVIHENIFSRTMAKFEVTMPSADESMAIASQIEGILEQARAPYHLLTRIPIFVPILLSFLIWLELAIFSGMSAHVAAASGYFSVFAIIGNTLIIIIRWIARHRWPRLKFVVAQGISASPW